jgi:hypothetical protein
LDGLPELHKSADVALAAATGPRDVTPSVAIFHRNVIAAEKPGFQGLNA